MNESYPIELEKYYKSKDIENEPSFIWWVPYTLCIHGRFIIFVNARVNKKTHKYGI